MNETTAKSENDFKATSDEFEVGNADDEKVVGAKVREAEGLSLGANVRSAVVVILVGARVGDASDAASSQQAGWGRPQLARA